MSDQKKPTIDDKIEVLISTNDTQNFTMEYKTFAEKMEELYKSNMHKPYTQFNVAFLKDKELGFALVFSGTREETNDETAKRETAEAMKKKQLDDAELKEYLRLRKKFGKQAKEE